MSVESVDVPRSADRVQVIPEIWDGYEVHRAALSRGMNVVLYPRQVLMVARPDDERELAFIHGIPESTTLGAATYAQDKRMRRALLERAGLPVPKGATFSVGRGTGDAKKFARRAGYPVVVKPAMGDNAIETLPDVQDAEQLAEAIDVLRTPPTERSTFTRAAYALTELREPGETEDGRVVVPPGYRFLVEKQVRGRYVRLYVLDGSVCAAVLVSEPPGVNGGASYVARDVLDQTHETLKLLAVSAARSLPGLTTVTADIVVTDFAQPVSGQDVHIVELSERPGLAVLARASVDLSHAVGDAVLSRHAAERSVPLADARAEVAVDFHAEAIPDQDGAVAALADAARGLGLVGYMGVADRVEGVANGVLQGPVEPIAWLAEALLDGKLAGHRAMLVEERQREGDSFEGFTVRS